MQPRYRLQAHRTARVPLWPLSLVLMLLSAAVTVAGFLWLLSWFLSLAPYVQSVAP